MALEGAALANRVDLLVRTCLDVDTACVCGEQPGQVGHHHLLDKIALVLDVDAGLLADQRHVHV